MCLGHFCIPYLKENSIFTKPCVTREFSYELANIKEQLWLHVKPPAAINDLVHFKRHPVSCPILQVTMETKK